jgi:hypothetical protein
VETIGGNPFVQVFWPIHHSSAKLAVDGAAPVQAQFRESALGETEAFSSLIGVNDHCQRVVHRSITFNVPDRTGWYGNDVTSIGTKQLNDGQIIPNAETENLFALFSVYRIEVKL